MTTTTRPLVEDYQADYNTRRENGYRWDSAKHTEECFLCGRGLTEKATANGWRVWLGTDGTLLACDRTDDHLEGTDLDQGTFPVGPECAKRIPLAYRYR